MAVSSNAGIAALLAAALVAACGGGGDETQAATPAAMQAQLTALASQRQLQPLALAREPSWAPTSSVFMDWLESRLPALFPPTASNRSVSGFAYRLYAPTGNIVATTGDEIFVLGPVATAGPIRLGKLADYRCFINPSGCTEAATLPSLAPASGGAPATTSVLSGVTASLRSPSRIDADVVQGAAMTDTTLVGAVSGSITQLSGRTLYVIVEDPHSLFQNPPQVSLSTASASASVRMTGRTLSTVGLMEGTLRVHVCLDSACGQVLAGSPLLVPYRVTVAPAVAVAPESVAVTTAFGQQPEGRSIQVSLPLDTREWTGTFFSSSGGSSPIKALDNHLWGNTVGTVALSFDPAVPGTYSGNVVIIGSSVGSSGQTKSFLKQVPVSYTVTANAALNYAMWPARTDAVVKYGERQSGPVYPHVIAGNTGITASRNGFRLLTGPVAAGSAGLASSASWWSDFSEQPLACPATACWPAGTYTGQVLYNLQRSGTTIGTATHPITLTIYP
ncbi:MAG: hypothetical protein HYX47_01190 [Burkholderiales bacterium]|nr:hypothetical protein [Burkholderiales bacterium]